MAAFRCRVYIRKMSLRTELRSIAERDNCWSETQSQHKQDSKSRTVQCVKYDSYVTFTPQRLCPVLGMSLQPASHISLPAETVDIYGDRWEYSLTAATSTTISTDVSAQFQIHTQPNSLVAAVGSDVILPCTITPPLPAAGLEVRWFHDLYHNIAFLLKEGREDRQQQSVDYRGRAFMLAGPDKGNLSLSLHQVRLSDAGKYHCFVENSVDKNDGEGIMTLTVVGLGTPPLVSVALQGSAVLLSCSSDQWFPEPSMFWMKGNGEPVPVYHSAKKNTSGGLIHASSSILLKDSIDGHLYCGLQHPVTKTETGVYVAVSDDMFPRASPWAIAFWILLIFSLAGLALLAWFFYSKQKEKESILFDSSTAYGGLVVSPDSRNITTTDVVQDVLQNPERFDTEPCVLGHSAFQSGTHYWETEVLERSGEFWSLGIAGRSVRRTGGQREGPDALIWAIRGTTEGYYALSTPPEPIVFESGRIQKVGVYLEYDKGKVTFYDVDTYRRLYTFTENFLEPVYPFYYVGPGIAFSLIS
ncbi:PREDICTED: butyrophilin subfamily 1 member A1-like [Nanorana parkeri]|uniref:butyrophilin subfamily 1 member A1-like n=1 Tax=Nanorana parkeri TaxID=125878 RepID=UPI000854415C|nr:PREDICTED: butyrophilin subfamily 1 member A1-like [Nanorana parkeri]